MAFLGIGWAFPPRATPDGEVALARYEDDVAQSIRIILGTNPGERVMRPTFGAGLDAFVFEPVSVSTIESLRTRVREALVDWEARIAVESVVVTPAGDTRNRLDIDVEYRILATNSLRNLVYPFSLQEGSAA